MTKTFNSKRLKTTGQAFYSIKREAIRVQRQIRPESSQAGDPSALQISQSHAKMDRTTKLNQLRNELQTLLEAEDNLGKCLNNIQHECRKVNEAEISPKHGTDSTLELMIVDKEISKVANENKLLRKEIAEVGQDTGLLLRQVNELLLASDARLKSRRDQVFNFGQRESKE